jgi:Zn-dependent M28 family amino/carboxypeptidase
VFGAAEPRLLPVDPARAARAAQVRSAIDPLRLRHLVDMLPAPRVRLHAPETMAAVDTLVLDAFTSAGWRAELRGFEARDVWAWADALDCRRIMPVAALAGVNVVGIKEGASRDVLVVVAHHDTVPGTGGADDNGSGVVALMELARLLGPLRLRRSVLLAAVDHEELGFFGSRQLVRELVDERGTSGVRGAFVYEMLAYTNATPGSQRLPPGIGAVYRGQLRKLRARDMRGDFTTVVYRQSARTLAACFAECLDHLAGPTATILLRAPTDLPVLGPLLERTLPFARDFARSDHVPFWEAELPAVQITDTANFRNPNYHGAGDIPDTLDYHRLADVVAATALAIERVAERLGP